MVSQLPARPPLPPTDQRPMDPARHVPHIRDPTAARSPPVHHQTPPAFSFKAFFDRWLEKQPHSKLTENGVPQVAPIPRRASLSPDAYRTCRSGGAHVLPASRLSSNLDDDSWIHSPSTPGDRYASLKRFSSSCESNLWSKGTSANQGLSGSVEDTWINSNRRYLPRRRLSLGHGDNRWIRTDNPGRIKDSVSALQMDTEQVGSEDNPQKDAKPRGLSPQTLGVLCKERLQQSSHVNNSSRLNGYLDTRYVNTNINPGLLTTPATWQNPITIYYIYICVRILKNIKVFNYGCRFPN